MDKYEYKLRADEIKDLIANREYTQAIKVADTIDWSRVRSVMMLCTISDLYKINRRYEDSRELLLMAYEKHPGGRMIIYSLCELSIKMGDFVQAIEYYKEFVQTAPKDTGRYILQYKLYEAQEVSLEERIEVLEEFKKRDYREKWAYELAYLYHRIGLSTKCVEECDELVLWFGEGKYVLKAMELKMLHVPLSREQQQKYNEMKGIVSQTPMEQNAVREQQDITMEQNAAMEQEEAAAQEAPANEMDIQVKTVKVGQYDTINLQKALAESMKELMSESEAETMEMPIEEPEKAEQEQEAMAAPPRDTDEMVQITPEMIEEDVQEEPEEEEIFFEANTAELNTAETYEQTVLVTEEGEKPEFSEEALSPEIAKMLSQEYDGQISLVVPDGEKIEKQITGQMSIGDILAEWERMKKENEQKRAEEVRQRVLEQTGSLFSDFDASTRSGILAQLDEAAEAQAAEEAEHAEAVEEPDDSEILAEEIAEQIEEETEEKIEEEIKEEEALAEKKALEEAEEEEELPEVEELEEVEEVVLEETAELPDNLEQYLEVTMNEEEETETENTEETEAAEEETEESGKEKQKASRALTEDEKDLYGPFIQTKREKNQIVNAVDSMSLAPYTGNVIITGDTGVEKVELAKNLIKEIQMSDSNFSGKVAKISGKALNSRDVEATVAKMSNGALIIEKAGEMNTETAQTLNKVLEKGKGGIIIIMEDTSKAMNTMLESCHKILNNFTSRIDIAALDNDALVAYGKRYALGMEYSIDEMGVLALYTRISDMQTSDHVVTAAEIREIVDDAIYHADRKTIKHFMDLLVSKRYDEDDMIILGEADFME